MTAELNIFNSKERTIKCISNDDSNCWGFSGTGHMLTVGDYYTLTKLDVHGWHTRVRLSEFPGVWFNSVLFEEDREDE